jgi:hypothetical protein
MTAIYVSSHKSNHDISCYIFVCKVNPALRIVTISSLLVECIPALTNTQECFSLGKPFDLFQQIDLWPKHAQRVRLKKGPYSGLALAESTYIIKRPVVDKYQLACTSDEEKS